MFIDRKDAGKKLALKLEKYKDNDVIVLAVPRGGIVIAQDVIKKYGYKWDLAISRKIGAPGNKEMAIGAVSADGSYFVNEEYADIFNVSKDYIDGEVAQETNEIKRRMKEYRGDDSLPDVKNKTVIIMDDGIATGYTILATVKSVKNQGALKTVLAVPVGPKETIEELENIFDDVICLEVPKGFISVGMYYRNFDQVSDEEVFKIMKELRS